MTIHVFLTMGYKRCRIILCRPNTSTTYQCGLKILNIYIFFNRNRWRDFYLFSIDIIIRNIISHLSQHTSNISIGHPTRLFLPLREARFAGVRVKLIVSMSLDCVEFIFLLI